MVGLTISPAVEAVLTKCPKPCLRETGGAAAMPYRSHASLIRSDKSSRRFTSVRAEAASPPAAAIRSATAVRRSDRRAPSTTFAPRSASRSAVASPIPLLAPVIATTLPSVPGMNFSIFVRDSEEWPHEPLWTKAVATKAFAGLRLALAPPHRARFAKERLDIRFRTDSSMTP